MTNEQEQAEQVVDAEIEQTDKCLVKDRDEREAVTTELPCETKELLRNAADRTVPVGTADRSDPRGSRRESANRALV